MFQTSGAMSNSQSAHDVSACDDDDGYGEIGVYARRTGTFVSPGKMLTRKFSLCMTFAVAVYAHCRHICE